jgi:glycosyltransferase involved in cell wall biosynthesis
MKIWTLTIGEPIPAKAASCDRLHRTGALSHYMAKHGHQVTWWTSTFDHFRKQHFFDSDTDLRVDDNLTIRLIHGLGYKRNISLSRIRDHALIASKFAGQARNEQKKPDIVVAALPTIDLCAESVKFGRENGIPVLLDMRDMWPDIFVDALPGPARGIGRLAFSSMFSQAQKACSGATAIMGITDAFVDWGLARGKRKRTDLDVSFPFAYESSALDPQAITAAEAFWDNLGVHKTNDDLIACFVGTMGWQLDVGAIIDAARKLHLSRMPVRFMLCGSGERLKYFKEQAADCPNVVFPGWVNAAQIRVLMARSSLGLDPLPDRYDFLATLNNKALEYLSAALPVISSPKQGALYELIRKHECGLSYDCGNSDELSGIISGLTQDSTKLKALSNNALRLFTSTFTAEKVYADMTAYFESVAALSVTQPLEGRI